MSTTITKSTLLAAFCAVTMLLNGCGGTAEERETRAAQAIASGNLDQAKRELEGAQKTAAKDGASQDVRDRLAKQLAEVNAKLEVRRIAGEDDARAAGARALAAAKSAADARNWKQMVREVDSAKGFARKANDGSLNAAIDAMVQSQPMKLVRVQSAYRSLCNKAGWSTVIDIFDGDSFWLDLSTVLDTRFEQTCAAIGDSELIAAGSNVAQQWREYIRAKQAEEATRNSNDGLGIAINIIAGAGRVKNRIEYAQAQQRFEIRLNALMGATTMPAPTYAPTRRDGSQPAATPVATPVAAVISTAVPRAPVTLPAAAAVVAANSNVVVPPTPTRAPNANNANSADRSAPNFDDLR